MYVDGSSSETESDDETDTECGEDETVLEDASLAKPKCNEILTDSDDGDESVMRCPICLARLGLQCVGSPEACDHIFCLECLQEWAKVFSVLSLL